ncbi:MAG: hypothetical protein PGN09_03600 [Sphingomonas fennica]
MAATGAAVAGDGGEAGHGCDLLGGELSEFAQVCEEGEGGDGADAGNGPEDSRTPGDGGGLGDGGFDLPVEAGDVADDASAAAPERPRSHGSVVAARRLSRATCSAMAAVLAVASSARCSWAGSGGAVGAGDSRSAMSASIAAWILSFFASCPIA